MGRSAICLEVVDDFLRACCCAVLDMVAGLKAEAEAKKVKRVAVVNCIVIVFVCLFVCVE